MARPRKTQPVTKSKSKSTSKSTARPPSIRGEKRVKRTGASIPLGPARRQRGTHDGPTDPAAVDRRRQITGTDELK
jgi:hypothetical protein